MNRDLTAHHRHVGQFTAVGTVHSLLELTAISFMDDVELGSYNNVHRQIIVKIPWISEVLGVGYITHNRNLLVDHEKHFQWMLQNLSKNETKLNNPGNHTIQLLADCEIDNDIKIKSRIHLIWDGEEYCRMDEEVGHWENVHPEFKKYLPIAESTLWTNLRKHYMDQYCVDFLRKVVGYRNLRDNVAPEMIVSQRVNPEGRIILSCTATGFYPHSILLHWEKNGELGVWGKETSSGILPNVDSTFFLQITLELPPEDSEMSYTCVVEHSELKNPVVYPVPGNPKKIKPWVLTLGIVLSVILLLSCIGTLIVWRKRKSGSMDQVEGSFPSASPTPSPQ
ncbi:major histocompatibility complex class I-related gene protein-like isoform X2 [Macrotis lagotis]|uniref:major histocompatibility complex class I-related gene protein-like isoform X2 n=1 Tax=Macrotis lagotis TaxID=92651 RepID=UPI003D68C0E9